MLNINKNSLNRMLVEGTAEQKAPLLDQELEIPTFLETALQHEILEASYMRVCM